MGSVRGGVGSVRGGVGSVRVGEGWGEVAQRPILLTSLLHTQTPQEHSPRPEHCMPLGPVLAGGGAGRGGEGGGWRGGGAH